MSESAKEVFERIPEARRDAAVREADERCHGLYARAWQENCGDVFEKGRAAVAAEDAARAAVFARFVEPVAPSSSAFERIPEHRRYAALRDADHNTKEAYGIAANVCNGTAVEKAAAGLAAEMAAREAVFKRHAEMAATPLASSRDIFMRIPEQCRAAARKEANTMGNDAWQARYDNTRGDLAAAAQAEEAARAKVFSRYAAPVEAGPTISDVKAALNRIPKERRIDAMHLADTETADVYRDAFRAADGDMAAKIRAGSAAERAARIAVFEKYAAQAVGESVIDAIEARVNSHTGMAARMDCAWLIGEVKRLRYAAEDDATRRRALREQFTAAAEARDAALVEVDRLRTELDGAQRALASESARRELLRSEVATARAELDAAKNQLCEAATSIDVLREKCYDANTELVRTRAELQRWKRERCMLPAVGPWSADGARIIGRGNRIVAHTSSQSSPNPDAVQDAHAIAEMLNHAEAQAPLDAFDATWERVRIAAERAHQALSQFGETQAPEAIELRAALDALSKPAPSDDNPHAKTFGEQLRVATKAPAATLPDASRAMLTAALADAEEELRRVHGTERTLSAYASAFGTVGQAVRMVLEASDRTAPSPAWERLRVAAEGALRSLDDSRVVLPHEARELRAALDAIDCKPVPEQQNISVSKLRGSFSRARLDEVSLAAAEAKAAERDAIYAQRKPAPAVDGPKLGHDTYEPEVECRCVPRDTAADHDDACSLHPSHAENPSDAWPRVVFVGPFGYDRDDHLNPTFSGQISGAKRFSDTEAQKRASQLRVAGYQKVRVIRLRPRAK